MTVHVPRLPFSLDPLVPEARRRMRRRRLLITAALVLVSSGTAAGVLATRGPAGASGIGRVSSLPAGTRSCGVLGVGIGWRVWASPTLSCTSGRAFMGSYITRPGAPAPEFRGYACATREVPEGFGFSCVRGEQHIVAVANH